MIEIADDFWVDPKSVTVVKVISAKKCALWVTGQSALEGFVLDTPAEEVIEALHDAIYGEEPDDQDDEEEIVLDEGDE